MNVDDGRVRYGAAVSVWAALIFLTAAAVAMARPGGGGGGPAFPVLIASVKALLVIYFFMRLRFEKGVFRLIPAVCVITIIILMLLVFSDVAYR